MRNAHFLSLAIGLAALSLPAGAVGQTPDGAAIAEGARIYSQTCGRCHAPRAATEHSDRAWATIMSHMRIRANLSKEASDAVLAFLQTTNLPEVAAAPPPSATPAPPAAAREARGGDPAIPAAPAVNLRVDPPRAAPSDGTGRPVPVDAAEANPADELLAFQLRQIGMPITAGGLSRLTDQQKQALARYVEKLLTEAPRR